MWTRKLSIQLYLAHIAKKYKKEETKTNKRQCPFNSVQIHEGSPEGNKSDYGGKDL